MGVITGLLGMTLLGFVIWCGVRFVVGWGASDGGGVSLGHATLNCPHCGKETRAGAATCEHCGREL